jgi:hypothetical protein
MNLEQIISNPGNWTEIAVCVFLMVKGLIETLHHSRIGKKISRITDNHSAEKLASDLIGMKLNNATKTAEMGQIGSNQQR